MKIKLSDKVKWLGKEFTVTEIHPMPFALCSLTDGEGHYTQKAKKSTK